MEIYYGELTPEQMQQIGATYQACANCGETPLIWQQGVSDAVCESCGAWQKDVLPDGLTGREIEKWYRDKENGKMKKLEISSVCNRCLSIVSFQDEDVTNGYFAYCSEHDEDLERWETYTQFCLTNELADVLENVLGEMLQAQGRSNVVELQTIYDLLQTRKKGEKK